MSLRTSCEYRALRICVEPFVGCTPSPDHQPSRQAEYVLLVLSFENLEPALCGLRRSSTVHRKGFQALRSWHLNASCHHAVCASYRPHGSHVAEESWMPKRHCLEVHDPAAPEQVF